MFNINKISEDEYKAAKKVKDETNYKLQVTVIFMKLFGNLVIEFFKWIARLFQDKETVKLSGRLALVTGGGNGLGRALSFRFAQEGCDIAIVDIDIKNANKTASEIREKFKVTCKAYQCDISKSSAIHNLKSIIEKEMRCVDILVNNAGLLYVDDFINSNVNDIEKVVQVNLTAQIMMAQIFLSGMIERKYGRIVSICSISALVSSPALIVYAGTKWGLNGFMKSLNDELLINDNEKYIKLTTVYPDFMETREELSQALDQAKHFLPRFSPEEVADETIKGILAHKTYIFVSYLPPIVYSLLKYLPNNSKKYFMYNIMDITGFYKNKT